MNLQKVPISEDNDMNEDLETTKDNDKQYQTEEAWDRTPKQNSTLKKIEILKSGQTIKCKFANDTDSEWRKLNIICKKGKATGKNKHLMNVVMKQGEPCWLDFKRKRVYACA